MPDLIRTFAGRFVLAMSLAFAGIAVTGCSGGSGGPLDTGTTADTGVSDDADAGGVDAEDTSTPDEDTSDSGETDPDTTPERDVPQWDTSLGDTGDDDVAEELSLERVSPTRGPLEGGTPFIIDGRGFTSETTVFFGSREAQSELVDGQLVGQTPEGAGTGAVAVKALDPETGDDVLQKAFTYTESLRVDSVIPDRIPTEGGVEVTIRGNGFDKETRVSFDGTTGLHHEFVDGETLRVLAPANEVGPADLRVTTREESTSVEEAVTYFAPLTIDSVEPATGPTGGGTQTTLVGQGFDGDITVSFGDETATLDSVTADGTEATVTTPAHSAGLVDVGVETAAGDAVLAEDAFYYRQSASEFHLAAVNPAVGPSSGNIEVRLVGAGLDNSGLTVEFGGSVANVKRSGTGFAVVELPSHATGSVDVVIADDQGNSSTLTDGFRYLRDLAIDRATPGEGDTTGGTSVELEGTGFQGTQTVLFGGIPAEFTVDSDQKLTAKAPAHSPGPVDVVVDRDEVEATLEDGFTYTEDLDVYGFSPVRGSVAGGTYIEIRGRGFGGDMGVTFGSNAGKEVEVVDSQTLAVRTPKHQPAAVDVTVRRDETEVRADQQYTYFNPGSRTGGAWGGPIQGAVNVTVYSTGGQPIPNAFVMLSTNPETTYQGTTDPNGLVTLSGPDVYGEQTITATAAGYTSATIQHVDAENITIFLTSLATGNGAPPPGPPTATFEGKLSGIDKVGEPTNSEFRMGIVMATRQSPWSDPPDPGNGNVVQNGNGDYTLTTRIGDLALVALGGLYDTDTETFRPIMMGVKRYQFAAEGKTYQRDIELDIPLDEELRFKLQNPPHDTDGPNINRITPWIDFGFEGVFGGIVFAEGTSSTVTAENQPPLTGQLSDVSYMAVGGSYTENDQGGLGIPQSVAIKRGITDTDSLIGMPKQVGVAKITSPGQGEVPTDNTIQWKLNSSHRPDLFFIQVLTPMRQPMWSALVPGSASSVRLPDFPDFSHLPEDQRPEPYPDGGYSLLILAVDHPTLSYRNFDYSDLQISKWRAFSVSGQIIQF